ncbi:MAG TPA: hypothetical protein PLF79_02845 [Thauera sp.]|uniref:hypothetical protein n=1 Tax=Thauera sp. TaxID=1905334 RepID=UPI002C5FF38A|nr:hypothetical protein [Thauera sp.]HRP24354.1 hypothetical protein [Thauera sp.]HRP64977.1 hypothetical protein [Thauera sp.]
MRHPHEVLLGPPRDIATWPAEGCGAPAILQRSDDDFIPAVLAALREPGARSALRDNLARSVTLAAGADTRPTSKRAAGRGLLDSLRAASGRLGLPGARLKAPATNSGAEKAASGKGSAAALDTLHRAVRGQTVLKLFQPIQRQFHLAVMEARCDTPGLPRIDPAKVESAGLVIRRLRSDKGREIRQGWMRAADGVRGWVQVDSSEAPLPPRHDPDARRRLSRPGTRQPALDRELLALISAHEDAVLSEDVVPMFVAPPEVCTAAGATLFYGLVPTSSSDRAEGGAPAFDDEGFGASSSAFTTHLVGTLRGLPDSFPRPGRLVTEDLASLARTPGADQSAMQRLLLLLRQLAVEFGAFEDAPEADALMQVLDGIRLPLADAAGKPIEGTTPAGAFLRVATAILLDGDTPADPPTMPLGWPALDTPTAQRLALALHACLLRRFEALSGQAGRYDDQDAQYVLRAFVRLKPEGPCPARTVWSAYSPRFVIAPWYEGSGAPPTQVAMPDPTDKATLRKLKPNVAFTVPASMQHLLSGDPLDMLEGKKPAGEGLGLGWICGFNIPIITICAFIVLNIFLSLFDLFLRWMMFFKICIPFPKKGGGEGGGGGG